MSLLYGFYSFYLCRTEVLSNYIYERLLYLTIGYSHQFHSVVDDYTKYTIVKL